MWDFLIRLLSRESGSPSKETAKERLRLVLVHDRAQTSPRLLELLREDLIHTISKYMEIDNAGLEVNLERSEQSVALVANIPIKQMKRVEGAPLN